VNTHTHTQCCELTRSIGQPFLLWHPWSDWGLGALLRVLRVDDVPVDIEDQTCHLQVTSFFPVFSSETCLTQYDSYFFFYQSSIRSSLKSLQLHVLHSKASSTEICSM